jgi:hypothetical protein
VCSVVSLHIGREYTIQGDIDMSEMSSKLEQVLEYLVNGEQDKAETLLHDVIVEKARGIHEELVNAQN